MQSGAEVTATNVFFEVLNPDGPLDKCRGSGERESKDASPEA